MSDELAWELLRDEWELLLAIGAGPTGPSEAARRLGECPEAVTSRVQTLVEHGLVRRVEGGLALVPAFHKRQEGMSSYLRELVLERVDLAGAVPIGAAVRSGLAADDALRALISRAEGTLLPSVVAAASGPESDRSERFLAVFAVSSACPAAVSPEDLVGNVLRVLRAAALERANDATDTASKLWVAEMSVTPDVAVSIAETIETFLASEPATDGPGAATFAVWPVSGRPRPRPPEETP
ncbi:MAG: helix-turn-helix domain-containing protein [Myxococcota bacterium]